jgi:hypothetical protein
MNKTIYLRDEDESVWDRARELAGAKGISPLIAQSLKRFIAEKEAEEVEARGFERITVKYYDASDHGIPKVKAFRGKWIIPPTRPLSREEQDTTWSYSVAITAKGSAVVYWTEEDREGRAQFFSVYPSLESAAAESNVNWAARRAIEILGVPVEELDI